MLDEKARELIKNLLLGLNLRQENIFFENTEKVNVAIDNKNYVYEDLIINGKSAIGFDESNVVVTIPPYIKSTGKYKNGVIKETSDVIIYFSGLIEENAPESKRLILYDYLNTNFVLGFVKSYNTITASNFEPMYDFTKERPYFSIFDARDVSIKLRFNCTPINTLCK